MGRASGGGGEVSRSGGGGERCEAREATDEASDGQEGSRGAVMVLVGGSGYSSALLRY